MINFTLKIIKAYIDWYAKIERAVLEERAVEPKAVLLFFIILIICSSLALKFFSKN